MTRLGALLLVCAAAAFGGVRAQGHGVTFELFCGYPAGETRSEPWQGGTFYETFYGGRLASDPDLWDDAQGSPCPPTRNAGRLIDALADAHAWLIGLGLRDPGFRRIGPIVRHSILAPTANGTNDRVRVYLNERPFGASASGGSHHEFLGRVYGSDCTAGSGPDLSLPFVTYVGSKVARLDRAGVDSIAAHELVHVLQDGQALWAQRPNCDEVPAWISEGIAQAFAAKYARERVPGLRPPIADRSLLLGRRDFRIPLVEDGPPYSPLPYDAHAFWRWLVETYGDDAYAFLARVVGTPLPNPEAADWLGWLERGLTGSDWGVRRPLSLLFPQFLASHAEWGTSRWPHIGDAKWRNAVYGAKGLPADGCEVVDLSLARPSASLLVSDLAALSGRCVRVRFSGEGVAADQPITYWARVIRPHLDTLDPGNATRDVDGLHLMFLEWGGVLRDGGVARCHEEEAYYVPRRREPAMSFLVPCSAKPYTSERPTESWMRMWETPVRSGGAWSDVLLLARTPEIASDAAQAAAGMPSFLLEFSLDAQRMTVDGQPAGPTQGGVNYRPPGFTRPPVLAEDGAPDFEAFDPSLQMFGQQAPGGLGPGMVASSASGIENVLVGESFDGDGDDVGRLFSFVNRGDPIPYGATGTFPGWSVEGVDPNHPAVFLGSDEPTASVTVRAWDDGGIHLAAAGTWCYANEVDDDRNCIVSRTIEAELWLAFGDTYDPELRYVTRDTPVQALYREAFAGSVGFAIGFDFDLDVDDLGAPPGAPSAPGGAGGSGGGGVAEAPGFVCTCTCDVLAEIDRLSESIDASTPGAIELVMSIGNCALRCVAEFAACEP